MRVFFAALVLLCLASAAPAQTAAERLARHAEAGTLSAGEAELQRLADQNRADAAARQALGMIQFARAVETLAQGLHRHGMVAPRSAFVPILRLPVPENARPEPLDYAKLRAIYVRFLADLAKAEATLAAVPSAGDIKLPLNLGGIRLDLNGDGRADEGESLGRLLSALTLGGSFQDWTVAFDRADGTWLRGYTHVLSSFLEFALAYDWRDSYDATAHLFFTGARDAANPLHRPVADPRLGREASNIGDVIALIHLVRWPLVEPERMRKAHGHLKQVAALSRQNWREILAETDDDREWLPAPGQSSRAVTVAQVTQERVDGWMRVMDEFDAILDGRKLLGHWRLSQGIDMRAFFHEPRPFDLVLWMTGHAARPYLKDGPVATQETARQFSLLMGGNFMTYAFWFN